MGRRLKGWPEETNAVLTILVGRVSAPADRSAGARCARGAHSASTGTPVSNVVLVGEHGPDDSALGAKEVTRCALEPALRSGRRVNPSRPTVRERHTFGMVGGHSGDRLYDSQQFTTPWAVLARFLRVSLPLTAACVRGGPTEL